jgi:DNA-binding HxlR family transcriptional regulator
MTGPLEPRDAWVADDCTIARSLELLSTRSAFLLLREAFYGATRFEEFVARTRLSEPSAAARLRDLVAHGLLERRDYREPGQRTRPGYALTEKGADLLPVLVALMQWGDRWVTEQGSGPVAFLHRGCGATVRIGLRCGDGHRVTGDGDLDLALTP